MSQKIVVKSILCATITLGLMVQFNCTKKDTSEINNENFKKESFESEKNTSSRGPILPTNTKEKRLADMKAQADSGGKQSQKTAATLNAASITSYGCGSSMSGSYYGSGYYNYPYSYIDLTSSPQGLTISINVSSYDVPNKFDVYDGNGNFLVSSGWMGYATYSGPWGPSLNSSTQSKVISFLRNSSTTYTLRVATSTQDYSDAWDASVSCATPLTVAILKSNSTFINLVNLNKSAYLKFDTTLKYMSESEYQTFSDRMDYLCNKENLDVNESSEIAQMLQFGTSQAMADYANQMNPYVSSLRNQYSQLQDPTSAILDTVKKAAYELTYISMFGCLGDWKNCISNANASYTLEIIKCTAEAIGVGEILTPVAGIIFQLGCGGAAINKRRVEIKICNTSYNDCINNRK